MQYEEARFGYPNGACVIALWRVHSGASPPALGRTDVWGMEPGKQNLALRTLPLPGRRATWRATLAPG
eukprot:11670985-Alexandrium_andersonii.AAC.1